MQVLCGICPDTECKKLLYFPANISSAIECTNCGQHHEQKHLVDIKPVSDPGHAIRSLLQNIIAKSIPKVKKTSDSIKVKGLSNYSCKLISPLLTRYGLHKGSQEVKLLQEMGQGVTFNCANLADRAFMIEEQNLLVTGYGRDSAAEYLKDTLEEIFKVNDNEERIVPIHADGDGHCLLHAISRALVGRELFWHPLMTSLKLHLTDRQSDYKRLLQDFIADSEWEDIIQEADPNFVPSDGETHGLRNIHVFGLANVLHRPIILIDSFDGMQSKGDYSAVFLPALIPPEQCRSDTGGMHKPIVIAWSSKGRNHFVPLVGIQNRPLPKFPKYLLPKLWALPQSLLYKYIDFDNNVCVIGGNKTLKEQYLLKLVAAMEKHFKILNGVAPSVVTDVYNHVIGPSGVVGITTAMVIEAANASVKEERLYKCLQCQSVLEEALQCPVKWLQPGGTLYTIAEGVHGTLKDGYQYKFPHHNNIVCRYNKEKDRLMYVQNFDTFKCKHCSGSLRVIKSDGGLVYFNGDQLPVPASPDSKCGCGYKHYWEGKEYDNIPQKIPVTLEWTGVTKHDYVFWFQNEADQSLNSNAFEIAQKLVQKYFPGEFGSERLVQKVVDQIFNVIVRYEPKAENTSVNASDEQTTPMKIILTGPKSKTIHKEELNASKSEQILRKKIEHGAVVKQKRLSTSPLKHSLNLESSNKKVVENYVTVANTKEILKTQRKIRISVDDQGSEMYTLLDTTTYDDIQTFIQEKFNIEKELQIIKYGFPPKSFEAPVSDMEPVTLKHGEKLTVHKKKVTNPNIEKKVAMEVELAERGGTDVLQENMNFFENTLPTASSSSEAMTNRFTSSLFSLLENVDLWDWACTQRHLFQQDGLFYKQAHKDLGILTDNQHFSLPCFPNKLFSYNQKQDEIFLCLGETHSHIKVLSSEELTIANQQGKVKLQAMSHPPQEKLLSHNSDFTIPLSTNNINSKLVAFSGAGHSMIEKTNENITESETMDEVPTFPITNTSSSSTEMELASVSNKNDVASLVPVSPTESGMLEAQVPYVIPTVDTNIPCESASTGTGESEAMDQQSHEMILDLSNDKNNSNEAMDDLP